MCLHINARKKTHRINHTYKIRPNAALPLNGMHLNSLTTECWTPCRAASSSGTAWVDNAYARSLALGTPLRQCCGWNSTQHQTWRRALRGELVHASILCWIELYCFGVRRYFWKCTIKCVAELQTLGGKNSSVFNACNSGLMLGGKFKKIRGVLGGKFEDAGWKLHQRVRERSK